MANIVSVNMAGISQVKRDKITDALGFTTKEQVEDFLEGYLISEVKAHLVYKAKTASRETNKDLDFS